MAYDEQLADRMRAAVPEGVAATEQAMFGGLALLVGGHLAVGVSGQGGLMVRTGPEEGDHLVATSAATPMEMRGRPMRGWLRVPADAVRTDHALARWVGLGVATASALPPKTATGDR